MSVNAYRVNNNKLYSELSSFDIWHDTKLMDFLNKEIAFYMSLNSYGTGIVDVPVELLSKIVDSQSEFDLDDDTISQIKIDISHAKSRKDEVVTYYCF